MIPIFGYIGAVYSLLLMNITSQIIYQLLLRRVKFAPNQLAYLTPLILLVVAISIYLLLETDSNLLKLLLVGLYIGACWILIKEIRETSHLALKNISRSRVNISRV